MKVNVSMDREAILNNLQSDDFTTKFVNLDHLFNFKTISFQEKKKLLTEIVNKETHPGLKFKARKLLNQISKQIKDHPDQNIVSSINDTEIPDIKEKQISKTPSIIIQEGSPEEKIELLLSISKGELEIPVSLIVEQLKVESDLFVLSALIKGLGKLGTPGIHKNIILEFLKHDEPRIRANAIEGLELFDVDDIYSDIIPMLKDENNRVRANAAKALNKAGSEKVYHILETMVNSGKIYFLESAIFALEKIGNSPKLKALLEQANNKVKTFQEKSIPVKEAVIDNKPVIDENNELDLEIQSVVTEKMVLMDEALEDGILSADEYKLKKELMIKQVSEEIKKRHQQKEKLKAFEEKESKKVSMSPEYRKKLEALKEALDDGILSEEEFKLKKEALEIQNIKKSNTPKQIKSKNKSITKKIHVKKVKPATKKDDLTDSLYALFTHYYKKVSVKFLEIKKSSSFDKNSTSSNIESKNSFLSNIYAVNRTKILVVIFSVLLLIYFSVSTEISLLNILFKLLWLVSVLGFIIGIVEPSIVRLNSRKKVIQYFVLAIFIFAGLSFETNPPNNKKTPEQQIAAERAWREASLKKSRKMKEWNNEEQAWRYAEKKRKKLKTTSAEETLEDNSEDIAPAVTYSRLLAKFKDSEWEILSAGNWGQHMKSLNPFQEDATTSGKFIIIKYSVTNLTNKEKSFFVNPKLKTSDGREYNCYVSQSFYIPEGGELINFKALPAGLQKTFYVIYEVPSDASGFKFEAKGFSVLFKKRKDIEFTVQ